MIRINLLPGGKKKRSAGAPTLNLDGLKAFVAQVKDPLLIGVAASWAVGILVIGGLYTLLSARVGSLEDDEVAVRAEARRFRTLIVQKQRSEQLRDSLRAELVAIREIDADRYVWPHILEEVTKALPDFTWLVSVDALAQPVAPVGADTLPPPPLRFQIDGRTADMSAYTRFVRQLSNSPWFSSVDFGPTTTVIEEDRPITAFTITVTFQQADSAFIQTVPVLESVQ